MDHICEIAEDLFDYPPNRRVRVNDHHLTRWMMPDEGLRWNAGGCAFRLGETTHAAG